MLLLENCIIKQIKLPGPRVYDVAACLGEESDLDPNNLAFAIFDILQVNTGDITHKPFEERHRLLQEKFPEEGEFHRVTSLLTPSNKIAKLFQDWVIKGGEEGVIARALDYTVYKIKPRHNLDVVIIGYTERSDAEETISTLLTALVREDGSFQVLSRVGTGFSEALRNELYLLLKPLEIESQYREADGNHTLFTFVQPTFVIEIAFLDLIFERSDGRNIMKAVLNYDKSEGYSIMMPERCVGLISPIFARLRDDKQVNPSDLRMSQLRPYVDLDNLGENAKEIKHAQSEILLRVVYKKNHQERNYSEEIPMLENQQRKPY